MADEANLDEAAALAVKYEIVASEAIASAALPDCNLVYIADPDTMREYLQGYFEVLYQVDPTAVGGSVPDDAFYRKGEKTEAATRAINWLKKGKIFLQAKKKKKKYDKSF